jgi:hypothetical protein
MILNFYPEELDYVNAQTHPLIRSGDDASFLRTFCLAAARADSENYELLRPVLIVMMIKYPADPKRLAMERIDSGRALPGDRELMELT